MGGMFKKPKMPPLPPPPKIEMPKKARLPDTRDKEVIAAMERKRERSRARRGRRSTMLATAQKTESRPTNDIGSSGKKLGA
jgi:hypothetical protein